ncbi:MAG: Zn-dependent exopeptidase M28, partial [Candidatus Zixiibacteriota bacterium]
MTSGPRKSKAFAKSVYFTILKKSIFGGAFADLKLVQETGKPDTLSQSRLTEVCSRSAANRHERYVHIQVGEGTMRLRFTVILSLLLVVSVAAISVARDPSIGVATLPEGQDLAAFWDDGFQVYTLFGNKAVVGFEKETFSAEVLEKFALQESPSPGPGEALYLLRVTPEAIPVLEMLVAVNYFDGENALIIASPEAIERIARIGFGLTRIPMKPLPRPEVSGPSAREPLKSSEGFLEDILARFTEADYRTLLYRLQAFVTRYSYADSCRAAEEWGYDYLEDLGLDAEFFEYYSSWRNVIGTQPGLSFPDSILIICGHMDATSGNPRYDAPGAEDNASGSAAVLQTATVLSDYTFDYTIQYVLFTGEEQGLVGSEAYAWWAYQQNLGIIGVLNFDMISYEGGYGWDINIYADRNKPLEIALGDFLAQMVDDYTDAYSIRLNEDGPTYGSDHFWFSVYGFPAIFSIDAQMWSAPDFYPWYHSTSDTVGNLDTDFGIEVVKGAGVTMASLAEILAEKIVRVELDPESPSIMIPPEGGSFTFNVSLTNSTSQAQDFYAWVDVILP